MPVDIKILQDGSGILYLCHGTVTGKDFIEANQRLLTFDNLKQVRYGIVDETAVDDIHMSESDMLTITAQDEKIANIVPSGAVVAVIAAGDFAFGLARIWESFIEHAGWETMTFRTRWKAESWVKEKVKANFGIDVYFS
ncbi:MAG TPA: hypothetical protein VLG72_06590 [Nitrospirota bacterium]|nr:hypothetical protein [Nitrospirota bacterium]